MDSGTTIAADILSRLARIERYLNAVDDALLIREGNKVIHFNEDKIHPPAKTLEEVRKEEEEESERYHQFVLSTITDPEKRKAREESRAMYLEHKRKSEELRKAYRNWSHAQ